MKAKQTSHPLKRRAKSTGNSCKEIMKHICGELDEQINSLRCLEIKQHLKTCPNCTAYLDSLKKTVHLFREYPDPELADKCRKELFSELKIGK
jgi:hypothetical protein